MFTHRWRRWASLPALSAITLVTYRPVWFGGVLWDDAGHLTKSALQPASGLWRIWFDIGATQQYYPIVHSAFWLMHHAWGDATLGYHLANILLHALSAFLLLNILERLRIPGALLAACVFAVHPVQVESVAWMSELKNVLSGVFYFGAVLAYLRFDRSRERIAYAAALGLFVLALLSKSVTATLPAALLVVFWWQRGRLDWRRDVQPLLPFAALGVAAGLTTAWIELTMIGASGAEFALTPIDRVLVAGRAFWFYCGKALWPSNLIFIYPRWQIDAAVLWQYLYPIAAAGLVASLWLLRRRTRAPLAAVLFTGATLFPALGFFNAYPFRYAFVADHFQYLAIVGLITLGSAALTTLAGRWRVTAQAPQAALIAVICTPLALHAWHQSKQYADAETLYRATLDKNPACWLAYNNLGGLKLHGPSRNVTEAVSLFQASIAVNPNNTEAHDNLGSAWKLMGRLDDAVAEHREALRLDPARAQAHNNLGVALAALGRDDEAVVEFREAVRLNPDLAEAHNNLGNALDGEGELDAGMNEHETAIQIDPEYAEAYDGYGLDLQERGRFSEAMTQHQTALRLEPDNARAHVNLGNALRSLNRSDEAIAEYGEALRLDANDPAAHDGIALALDAAGRPAEALRHYAAAAALTPGSAARQDNLAEALRRSGARDDAIAHLRAALRLDANYGPAHYHLGNLWLAANRLSDAAAEFQAALAYDQAPEVHNNLGVALIRLGRRDEAIREFREAIKLDPSDPGARDNLSRALSDR